ncbi:MAG TPA: DUF4192 domain-containing protein [Actinospica sp.]|nr:DUF4192 domain-containing protein [Actinospica sp.]
MAMDEQRTVAAAGWDEDGIGRRAEEREGGARHAEGHERHDGGVRHGEGHEGHEGRARLTAEPYVPGRFTGDAAMPTRRFEQEPALMAGGLDQEPRLVSERYGDGPALLADRFEGFQIAAGSEPDEGVFGQVTVRLTSPGEVAAAVPHFFGFVPDDSVVVLGLGPCGAGGRSSICHGMRVDLGDVERDPSRFGRWAVEKLLDEGAVEAIVLIYPRGDAEPVPTFYRRLSMLVCAQLRRSGLTPLDSMFVAVGRWWSFLCERAACCPPEGTPIDPAASEVAALSTYSGLVVLPSRGALAETLRPYPADTVERTRVACTAFADAYTAETGRPWGEARRSWGEVRELWRLADEAGGSVVGPQWRLPEGAAARLLLNLPDVRLRDYLATWCATERAGQALALSVELARRAVTAEQAAAGYSVAAWASWALGWGAWAALSLDRALAAVPDYSLAVLIQQGIDRGVGPALVRVASHGTAQRLRAMAAEGA